jgi:hypothetical protein
MRYCAQAVWIFIKRFRLVAGATLLLAIHMFVLFNFRYNPVVKLRGVRHRATGIEITFWEILFFLNVCLVACLLYAAIKEAMDGHGKERR